MADNASNSKATNTESDGTTVTREVSHTDSVGTDGVSKSSDDATTIVNPSGTMNEKSAKSHNDRTDKPNGDYAETNTIRHANGTEEKESVEKSTAKHWTDKGKTTTTTRSHSVDPKGMYNKTKSETKVQVDTDPNGSEKKTVTKTVNGETVSEDMNVNHK